MALDHYVSQVYLKNFYSPELGNAFYVIRKNKPGIFHQSSTGVCRIEKNSTNAYLKEDRIIEEFLKGVEPNYNKSLENIISGNINTESIYVIAGFVAYILTCSPAAMRIQSHPLKNIVEVTSEMLDSMGKIPAPPEILGGKTLSKLIEDGKIEVKIDPKYPQAIGITNILSILKTFGNSTWEILLNNYDDNPFFTSDFPVAIEKTNDNRILNRLVPLSPYVAIRINPDINLDKDKTDYDFSKFRYLIRKIKRKEIAYINKQIVKCAETIVIFRNNLDWVNKFIKKYSNYRIEPKAQKISLDTGNLLWFSQEIVKI